MDFLIGKTGPDLILSGHMTVGGKEDDWCNAMGVTQNHGIVALGTTESFGAGGRDVFLVYVSAVDL